MDKQIETTTAYIVTKEPSEDSLHRGPFLEKKEDHIVLSRQEFEKAIDDAFTAGEKFADYLNEIVLAQYPNRETYLSTLLKPKING